MNIIEQKLERLIAMEEEGRLAIFLKKQDYPFLSRLLQQLSEDRKQIDNENNKQYERIFDLLQAEVESKKDNSISTQSSGIIQTTYDDWKTILKDAFPELFNAAEVCASVIAQLKINDIKNPCAVGLIDVPSSGKTLTLNFFSELEEIVYFSDNFTPASFVSHAANVKKEKLAEIDLLPRIKDKALVVPELAPLFGERDDDLLKNFGILTRVLDGEGLQTDTGVHGRRGYKGDFPFVLLAGSTPIPPRVWKVMGNLGARLLFYSIRSKEKSDIQLVNQLKDQSWKEKQKLCQKITASFIRTIWSENTEGVNWERNNDSEEVLQVIAKCAKLLARLRAPINVWKDRVTDGEVEYSHTVPVIEKPDRINQILYNIARGHALISGRKQLIKKDLRIVLDITFDSCPLVRSKLIRLLLSHHGEVNTTSVVLALNCSDETARKEMEAFKVLGLVELTDEEPPYSGRPLRKIVLKSEFKWFLSDESKELTGINTESDLVGKVPYSREFDAV